MESVLLAIEGMYPDRTLISYAASLCRRIRAELRVLYVIDPGIYEEQMKTLRKQLHRARDSFESTMIAASFAESGEFDTAGILADKTSAKIQQLLSETDKKAVKYRVQVKPGRTGAEILKHVNQHRDIVLAICDSKTMTTGLRTKLSVPLVVCRSAPSE